MDGEPNCENDGKEGSYGRGWLEHVFLEQGTKEVTARMKSRDGEDTLRVRGVVATVSFSGKRDDHSREGFAGLILHGHGNGAQPLGLCVGMQLGLR